MAITPLLRIRKLISDRLEGHTGEVARGTVVAFALKVVGTGLAFAFNVLLGRFLGAEGAGLYFLAFTVVTIAMVGGRLGLDNAVLRFVAAGAATADWARVKGVYRRALRIALAASTAATIAVVLTAPWLARRVFDAPALEGPIRWMAVAIIPMVLVFIHGQVLKGLKRIFDSLLVNGVAVPALATTFFLLMAGMGVEGAVWAYVLAAASAALLGAVLWHIRTPQLRGVSGHFRTRELLDSSLPLLWVASMNLLMTWTATFFLGIWTDASKVGIFNMASRTALLTTFVLVAVNSIAAPIFAGLYRKGEIVQLGETARSAAKLATVFAAPVVILLLAFPALIMSIFGPEFVPGSTALRILTAGQFVDVSTGSVGFLLMMTGHERIVRNNVIFVTGVNLVLNLVLVPPFGLIGAAIATAMSAAILNLVALYLAWRIVGVWTLPFIPEPS